MLKAHFQDQNETLKNQNFSINAGKNCLNPEVRFVTAVTAAGSVKFFASGVNLSIFTHFLCVFITKSAEIQ